MKILILNSDTTYNRGDRAILAGLIEAIRNRWKDAEIYSISEKAERDKNWFGIEFIPMSVFTLNPFHLIKLAWYARKCDLVLWGGGELLKDYTNQFGLWYWTVKLSLIRMFNSNIYGAFQGIGPTRKTLSRMLIRFVVNRTKAFMVRDQQSMERLTEWGVSTKLYATFDPAILESPDHESEPCNQSICQQVLPEYMRDKPFVGIGARNWFHYKPHSLLPYRWQINRTKGLTKPSSQQQNLIRNLAALADWIADTFNVNVVFFPMHMGEAENDAGFSDRIISAMKNKKRTAVIAEDSLSPQEFFNLISRAKCFIGVRLHSTIIAAAARVPVALFYYADKGRLFFDQIDMSECAWPIEIIGEQELTPTIKKTIQDLIDHPEGYLSRIAERISTMRRHIGDTMDTVFHETTD